jgi:hypothetical protein
MTAIVYLGEILVASLLAIVLLAISHFRMSGGTALFVGGVVGWTLAEYLVHRFVLHGLAPSQHGLHHANPDEAVLTIFWQIWVCFAVAYLIAGGAFVAGALIAYAWYLFVHHCSLHGPDKLPLNTAQASPDPSQIFVPKLRRQHDPLGPCIRDDAALISKFARASSTRL